MKKMSEKLNIVEGQNLEVDSIALPDMYEFVVKKSGTEKKYRTSYLIPIIKIFKGSFIMEGSWIES